MLEGTLLMLCLIVMDLKANRTQLTKLSASVFLSSVDLLIHAPYQTTCEKNTKNESIYLLHIYICMRIGRKKGKSVE